VHGFFFLHITNTGPVCVLLCGEQDVSRDRCKSSEVFVSINSMGKSGAHGKIFFRTPQHTPFFPLLTCTVECCGHCTDGSRSTPTCMARDYITARWNLW
jgi:hypothetical protein